MSMNADNRYEIILEEARMSVTTDYADAKPVIMVGDAVIGTQGNFSSAIGKAKSKKTFNVSAIVSAALCRKQILKYKVMLPSDRPRVLYIDTEQGKSHYQRVMKRVYRLAGMPCDVDSDLIMHYSLRKYTPQERVGAIEYAIKTTSGVGLVIIDGIRDLLYDINSPSEATQIVTLLLRWTDEYQFHLHTILHQNKSDDNARGHIGTELNNKAETVLQVEKDRDNPDISKVEVVHCRDREFEPFAFFIDENALPVLVEDYDFSKPSGKPKGKFDPYNSIAEELHMKALDLIFPDNNAYSWSELWAKIKDTYSLIYEPIGDNKAKLLLKFLSNKRLVIHKDETNQKSPWVRNKEARY